MPKGFFTQGVCLLCQEQPAIDDIKSALHSRRFEVAKQVPAAKDWCLSGPSVVVPFRPEANGYASIDVVNHPWPDEMGDPKSNPMLFGAWSMGHFGPFAYPGGLARARQHSFLWEQGRTLPERHRAFIRLRMSYVFGASGDAPVLPQEYDPIAEMEALSRMAIALFDVPGVICYFNPNGEVLCDRRTFCDIWDACRRERKLPLLLWMNVRNYYLNEQIGFMDTVGNAQLDVTDVAAVFPQADYSPGDIAYYVRNVTHYLLDLGRDIATGEAIDGPDETNLSWTAELLDEQAPAPPRRVLRLYPKAHRHQIQESLSTIGRSTC